jgi:hypothetical protein
VALELDHIFILVSNGALEAEGLKTLGLTEGAPNEHPGQGTACRRFFFANAYLELLWVQNPTEVQSELTRGTGLWERWSRRTDGSCPFGFAYRPSEPHLKVELPFATWEYRPTYLPEGWSIRIGQNARTSAEPMLFYLPFGRRPDHYPPANAQPLDHRAGFRELTRVELVGPPSTRHSPVWQAAIDSGLLTCRSGSRYLLELGFDGETGEQTADFRPALPILFRW